MENKSKGLFWYGFRARLMKAFGVLLFIAALIVMVFEIVVGFLIMALGIFFIAWGSRNLYDYKRRGGYIVYND